MVPSTNHFPLLCTHTYTHTHTHTHEKCTNRIVPLLVKLLHEYCQCANDLPMLITDVLGKLLELLKVCVCVCVCVCVEQFLLQFFNEQTCGLVLGAGAMKLQLKTITSRHLGNSAHMFMCTHEHMYMCACVHVYTCSCVHVYTCSCVHTHARTSAHT